MMDASRRAGGAILALALTVATGCAGARTEPPAAMPAPVSQAPASQAGAAADNAPGAGGGAASAVAGTPAGAAASLPAGQPLRPEQARVVAGVGSLSGNAAALWVAADKGHFAEYGLEVEPLYTQTIAGIQGMLAGEIHFMYTGCTEIMESRRAGSDLVLIAMTIPFNTYVIASRPEITEPRQLIDKRVAVNRLNDTSHLSARFAIKEAGVDPDAVHYVQVGSTPERFAALQAGGVEGALQVVTNVGDVRAMGMNVLVDLFERKVPYCGSGVGVSEAFLRSHPQTVEAFLRGFVKGNAYLREGNPDEVKQIMSRYMKTGVTEPALVSSYEYHAKLINPRYPVMSREGVAFVMSELGQREPEWLDWKPEQFYDTSITDRLQREGFLEAVYQQVQP
jgi:ABC-type nitrate/sulfonate/bicarbonate transport system substrate-binding protein